MSFMNTQPMASVVQTTLEHSVHTTQVAEKEVNVSKTQDTHSVSRKNQVIKKGSTLSIPNHTPIAANGPKTLIQLVGSNANQGSVTIDLHANSQGMAVENEYTPRVTNTTKQTFVNKTSDPRQNVTQNAFTTNKSLHDPATEDESKESMQIHAKKTWLPGEHKVKKVGKKITENVKIIN